MEKRSGACGRLEDVRQGHKQLWLLNRQAIIRALSMAPSGSTIGAQRQLEPCEYEMHVKGSTNHHHADLVLLGRGHDFHCVVQHNVHELIVTCMSIQSGSGTTGRTPRPLSTPTTCLLAVSFRSFGCTTLAVRVNQFLRSWVPDQPLLHKLTKISSRSSLCRHVVTAIFSSVLALKKPCVYKKTCCLMPNARPKEDLPGNLLMSPDIGTSPCLQQ